MEQQPNHKFLLFKSQLKDQLLQEIFFPTHLPIHQIDQKAPGRFIQANETNSLSHVFYDQETNFKQLEGKLRVELVK